MHLSLKVAGILPAPLQHLFQGKKILCNLLPDTVQSYCIGEFRFAVGIERQRDCVSPLSGHIYYRDTNPSAYLRAIARNDGETLSYPAKQTIEAPLVPSRPLYWLLDSHRFGHTQLSIAGTTNSRFGVTRDAAVWVPDEKLFAEIELSSQSRLCTSNSLRMLSEHLSAYNAYLKNQVYRVSVRQAVMTASGPDFVEIDSSEDCYGMEAAKEKMDTCIRYMWYLRFNPN